MGTKIDEAVSLLSVDVAQVTETVAKEALAAEKAYVEGLPDDKLMAEVACVEAELAKALAALEKKKGAAAAAAGEKASFKGPIALFEGTPIDCGAVAAAVVQAQMDALSTAELEAEIAQIKAELEKANAVLKRKQSAPAAAASAAPAAAASAAPAQAPRVSFSKSAVPPPSPLKRMSQSASQLLDDASEATGVDKTTLAATVIAGAAAVAAGLVGMFARGRR